MPNEPFYLHSSDRFISNIRGIVFNANSENPHQTPRSAASDLGLHCLPMPLLCGTLGINGLIDHCQAKEVCVCRGWTGEG